MVALSVDDRFPAAAHAVGGTVFAIGGNEKRRL